MRRAFLALPGPMPIRIVLVVLIIVVLLVVLNFVYDWMGNMLDTGGSIA